MIYQDKHSYDELYLVFASFSIFQTYENASRSVIRIQNRVVTVQTLTGHRTQFVFGDIQQATMFGNVANLQTI